MELEFKAKCHNLELKKEIKVTPMSNEDRKTMLKMVGESVAMFRRDKKKIELQRARGM